ncbi:hypothetical protein ACWCO3_09695, partial [Micromonospora sp. NPDC002411]
STLSPTTYIYPLYKTLFPSPTFFLSTPPTTPARGPGPADDGSRSSQVRRARHRATAAPERPSGAVTSVNTATGINAAQ